MRVGIGYSNIPDSTSAGTQAATSAVGMAGRSEPCDMAFLFCTARHNQQALRKAVSSVLGEAVPIYGGGAVGIITNHAYGYAGFQAGIACLWLDGARCDAALAGDLPTGEEDTGFRLGQELARLGVTPDSSTLLLYNAVKRDEAGMRLTPASRILAGLEKAMGFLPPLCGAGMAGDHACGPVGRYSGKGAGEDERSAVAFLFGDGIRMDSAVMHGCRPASPSYTVTKADGPVILEINGRPALSFMGDLLSAVLSPEQYPFFLLFGVNHGARGEENGENYAGRLCCGIDRDRGGIVMFEPDMAEGVEFQVMVRSLDPAYMKPRIESLFERLDDREPVFALYIDCAGRCAGFGGDDLEDALVLQRTVAGRVPLLGIYTGVEIAPVGGRPRSLNWTGVFCLFSQERGEATAKPASDILRDEAAPVPPRIVSGPALSERNMAEILALDIQVIALRYELELRRRGLRLLSELAVALRRKKNEKDLFTWLVKNITTTLNMQKTLAFTADGKGRFVPTALHGLTPEEQGQHIDLPRELLRHPVIVTGEAGLDRFAAWRSAYHLPYFVSSPVSLHGETTAVLITGRMPEQPPFFLRPREVDMEILQAVTGLLGSVRMHRRRSDSILNAETDTLTGLWNRHAFQRLVEGCLETGQKQAGAFIAVDVDCFKSINDMYGHITGDTVLAACADALQNTLRDSDIICRQGGDEFAVFCPGITNSAVAVKKAARIQTAWQTVHPQKGARHITACFGIALAPQHGVSFLELYANAEAALHEAKQRGCDSLVLFDAPMSDAANVVKRNAASLFGDVWMRR